MSEPLKVGDKVRVVMRVSKNPKVYNVDKIGLDGLIHISNAIEFYSMTKFHLEKVEEDE